MNALQRLRDVWLALLKHTLNRLTRRLAHAGIGPFAIVQHVGRRSGKAYETPLLLRRVRDGFVIELTYGPDVDWYKNVVAAGGGWVIWQGQRYPIDGVEPIATAAGLAEFSPAQQLILRLLRRTHFRKLRLRSGP